MNPSEEIIRSGKSVRVSYTAYDGDKIAESTEGRPPLYFVQGDGRVLPAFQKKIEGHKEGDVVDFELLPEEAYGPYRPEAVLEVPRSELPPRDLSVGMILQETQPDGSVKVGRIMEIRENSVLMNFNHPMAGKKLRYQVKIISVMSGTALSGMLPKMKFESEVENKSGKENDDES